jgi:hypothetical protein
MAFTFGNSHRFSPGGVAIDPVTQGTISDVTDLVPAHAYPFQSAACPLG